MVDTSIENKDHKSICQSPFGNTLHKQIEEIFPHLQRINGILLSELWNFADVRSALQYQARPDDIFIVSYPKSGTSWVQVVVHSLLTNGQPFDLDILDFETRTPFLEGVGAECMEMMRRPGTIKTHLPFNHVPYHPKARYICALRNPKDVCVSYYRFYTSQSETSSDVLQLADFIDLFLQGQVDFGDYFDHLQSVWTHKDDENVLIVLYEEMKSDLKATIQRIAKFLDVQLDAKLVTRVMQYSSFGYMKENYDTKQHDLYIHPERYDNILETPLLQKMKFFMSISGNLSGRTFLEQVKAGRVGDGFKSMTQDQNDRIGDKLRHVMQETGFLQYLAEKRIQGWLSFE